jgi:hypothetical protein
VIPLDLVGFQKLRVGPDGLRLVADGVMGPKTAWALGLESLPQWRQDVVLGALKWVGLREQGENRGPEIRVWLEACGVQEGNPWCAAFVSAILRGAGIGCNEASVARLRAKFPRTETPVPGDVMCFLREDGTGHTGIVTGVSADRVSTCEGNSQDGVRAGWRPKAGLDFVVPMGQPLPGVWSGLTQLGGKTV